MSPRSSQLAQKLATVEEIGSEHFGNGEAPQGVRHVFEELVFKKGREGRCTFG
jgi:hypothetical protein